MMIERILVTGRTGFVGSAIVRHLIRHTPHEVANLDKLIIAFAQYIAKMQYMKAKPITRHSEIRNDGSAVHVVIWELERPLAPCHHPYKYRLAYVVDGTCVMRYDNERGKGDHKHVGGHEEAYAFTSARCDS